MSQCQHCRALRRSKSAHVKCDCGEKTSKCVHLQPSLEGHRDSCCCNHGGQCTCSHKKEQSQLNTVPEYDSDQEASSSSSTKVSKTARNRRSRASTQNTDGMLCFDEHGHHKPTYKHAKPHQKLGPYQLTRGHSNQSTSSMEDLGDEESSTSSGKVTRARDQRLARSETASPLMAATSSIGPSVTSLPPLDTSAAAQNWFGHYEMFADDTEPPMMSAGLSCPDVDWAQYGLGFDYRGIGNMAPSSYSQAASFFDQPSTLPSGEVSEVEDLGLSGSDEFDPAGTFSRTNTSSTGFSFHPSQENLAVAVGMGNADLNFTKLNKEPETYDIDSTASFAAEDTGLTTTMPSYVQDEMFWVQLQDTDLDYSQVPVVEHTADLNDPNYWTTT